MERADSFFRPERAAGLTLVLALHAAALWGLWQHRLIPGPREAVTLFVNFIAPPQPEKTLPPPSRPQPAARTQPRQIVATAPVVAPTDHVAPAPPPQAEPVLTAPSAPVAPVAPPRPAGPLTLTGELSVACPERTPPRYPPLSRRMGEEGTVVLRVELDEQGKVCAARVSGSSGFERLDNAALEAVRTWQCRPAHRDGHAVRAVALQPFKFILQGS
ncbi:MAG: TonB family protein [Pseudomonadota bacterium]|jgi:protein TonB